MKWYERFAGCLIVLVFDCPLGLFSCLSSIVVSRRGIIVYDSLHAIPT
jgi:hypothetical protein